MPKQQFVKEKTAVILNINQELTNEMPLYLFQDKKINPLTYWQQWINKYHSHVLAEYLGLYLHIPFCAEECAFCACSKVKLQKHKKDYLKKILIEIKSYKKVLNKQPLRTLYFGGGTPSILSNIEIKQLFSAIKNSFNISHLEEFCFESDINSLTKNKIDLLKSLGVNRLSIGIQSINKKILHKMNRSFPQNIDKIISAITANNFKNINVDVLIGYPAMNQKNISETLATAIKFKPTKISLNIYNPTTKQKTPIKNFEKYSLKTFCKNRKEQYHYARTIVDAYYNKHGIHERDCLQLEHTIKQNAPIIGLGSSAVSRLPFIIHYKNSELAEYLAPKPSSKYKTYKQKSWQEELEFFLYNNFITGLNIPLEYLFKLFEPVQTLKYLQQIPGILYTRKYLRFKSPYKNCNVALLKYLKKINKALPHKNLPKELAALSLDTLLEIYQGF